MVKLLGVSSAAEIRKFSEQGGGNGSDVGQVRTPEVCWGEAVGFGWCVLIVMTVSERAGGGDVQPKQLHQVVKGNRTNIGRRPRKSNEGPLVTKKAGEPGTSGFRYRAGRGHPLLPRGGLLRSLSLGGFPCPTFP